MVQEDPTKNKQFVDIVKFNHITFEATGVIKFIDDQKFIVNIKSDYESCSISTIKTSNKVFVEGDEISFTLRHYCIDDSIGQPRNLKPAGLVIAIPRDKLDLLCQTIQQEPELVDLLNKLKENHDN